MSSSSGTRSRPIVYGLDVSPAVRAVLLTLRALGVEYELRVVNPRRGDNRRPEYVRMNPARTIPTLEHEGRFLGDSHAICAYLVAVFGRPDDDPLYPRDPYRRALVDQRLHFENGTLLAGCVHAVYAPLFAGALRAVPPERLDEMDAAYEVLERFLDPGPFVAGPHLTIADFSCVASVDALGLFRPVDARRHPRLAAWLERMAALPYYEDVMTGPNTDKAAAFVRRQLDSKL